MDYPFHWHRGGPCLAPLDPTYTLRPEMILSHIINGFIYIKMSTQSKELKFSGDPEPIDSVFY